MKSCPVKKLIKELSGKISKVEPNQKPNKIVKSIDSLIQEYYCKFYNLSDSHRQATEITKKGHCC